MIWVRASVQVSSEAAEAVADALQPLGHGGVLIEQDIPEASGKLERSPISDNYIVSIYQRADSEIPLWKRRIEEILWHMSMMLPIGPLGFTEEYEEDWATSWKKHYQPIRISERLVVCPAWLEEQAKPSDIVIRMDPGMAFGTGLHPTTRMCLEMVEEMVEPDMDILDLGTGSGILAIAAVKLGVESVLAIDNDKVAVNVARQNAQLNSVEQQIDVVLGSFQQAPQSATYDCVLVNILAPVIIRLLQEGMAQLLASNGVMVLSGLIDDQVADVKNALESAGLFISSSKQIQDWVTLKAVWAKSLEN
ncbi:MAG: 50S ribosomal protein L11 methyltransferase [Chloroflexota bacterium]